MPVTALPWTPIARPTLAQLVKDHIKRAIASGGVGPGDTLPNERDLAGALQVSRSSLRAAINDLREEGYLASAVGPTGGTRITTLRLPSKAARDEARAAPDRFHELMEYRTALECEAARLAAARRDEADLARLSLSLDELRRAGDLATFRGVDGRFHAAIAAAARNPAIAAGVAEARREIFPLIGEGMGGIVLHTTLAAHTAIVDAVARGDPAEAEHAMRQHLRQAATELLDD